MNETVLDRLVSCLTAALNHNPSAGEAPIALLWPDEARQWEAVVDRVAERLPVVTLDRFDPDDRRGPAYWIRCVVAGTLHVDLPSGAPVIYLPGVARSDLRAVDSCPSALAPIAELQYRSQWFSHPNSRDWSVRALLADPERGMGIPVAGDAETGKALLLALDRLLDEPVVRLARQGLDADFLHQIVNPDPVRNLLGWLDNPAGFRPRLNEAQWTAFVQQCKADYGFDPELDGEVTAARKLAERRGGWAHVWERFADTPDRFLGISDQLRKARPEEQLALEKKSHSEVWPQDNEVAEDELRKLLHDFRSLTAEGARKEASRLEAEHAWRRSTVWADLDFAPLAFALEQLARMAELTVQPLASGDLPSIREDYSQRGWQADDAVLRALAAARDAHDRAAVSAAVAAIYRPWLDVGAKALQAAIGPMANAHTYEAGSAAPTSAGTVTVFVDGLRLDIAHRVEARLAGVGLGVDFNSTLAPLPTVTPTAKAVVVPVAEGALTAGADLGAANSSTGTAASIAVLRTLMEDNGVQVLAAGDMGDPSGTAWTEAGSLDHRGHDDGINLVDSLEDEIARIVRRIRELIDAGWQCVEVVTDHGWILLPGGMEKVHLSPATAAVKKGRCARLKEGAKVDVPTVPWHWDQDVRIALAPGVACFEAGKEYEHGGVSPQECVVPRLTVTVGAVPKAAGGPEITSVKWLGLLCRIEMSGVVEGAIVDIRGLPGEPKTSVAEEAKETSRAGRVSLMASDDHEGERAYLVLVAPNGEILAQRDVEVGRNR